MGLARLHRAGALLVASLLLVLTAATDVHSACNATYQRDMARCIATQCAGVARAACRRHCKPARIRTLAYALTECRVDAAGFVVGRQALLIRRGDREPITVVKVSPSQPVQTNGLCRVYGKSRFGANEIVTGQLGHRLGVSPDGSGVVFEVTSGGPLSVGTGPRTPPLDVGMFFVRSDGHGLRRLGPPSRDPAFRTGPDPTGEFPFSLATATSIPVSPNGRLIAFSDLGPGPLGEEAVQFFVLDLATGQRRQVTHLPSGSPRRVGSFLTAYPFFIDNETIFFLTAVDPDGSNPEHNFTGYRVRIDGSRLESLPLPTNVAAVGSRVIPIFGVFPVATDLVTLSVPGTPVGPIARVDFPIAEVFIKAGDELIQLTNFRRSDTGNFFLNGVGTRAFFRASADPLGTNPSESCQIFSIGKLGTGLRQVTHFNPESPVTTGCDTVSPPGCQIGWGLAVQDPVTNAVVFDSSCDLLGTNFSGEQLFAMRPDGSGLRQLTDAAGFTENPDGSISIELPGPFAYSAALH